MLWFYPCPQAATSTNRRPVNNYRITGSIDDVTVYYDQSDRLYHSFAVNRMDADAEMQSLCLVFEAFNDIGSTVVYNSCIGKLSRVHRRLNQVL